MKKLILGIALLALINTSFAQRKGAIDTGGSVSFLNHSGSDSSQSFLNIAWLVGYYLNNDFLLEFEPSVQLNINENETQVSSFIMFGPAYKLVDLSPDSYKRHYRTTKRDPGISAGLFLSMSGGFWIDGYSVKNGENNTFVGPALAAGIGTHSGIAKMTLLRTKIQAIYLLPSGKVFDEPRTVIQVSIGFSIFVKI